MIGNGNPSSCDGVIKNIMTSCCVIKEEAILFEKLDEFARSKPWSLRHVTAFLLENGGSPVRRK